MRNGEHIPNASTPLAWRKSSYSGPSNGDCLEITGSCPGLAPIRDSKRPSGPALVFSTSAWSAFVGDLKEQRVY